MIDRELITRALAEDLDGGEDITSIATVTGNEKVVADFVVRANGVIAGIEMAVAVLEEVGLTDISKIVTDGTKVSVGQTVLTVRGDTRAILLAERTALNFLCHLSGIAAVTNPSFIRCCNLPQRRPQLFNLVQQGGRTLHQRSHESESRMRIAL